MSVTSNRSVVLQFTGDAEFQQNFDAATNATAPGTNQLVNLAAGANTITVPSGATGVTIIPPSGNTQTLILKGVTGDTGVSLSKTAPSSLGLLTVNTFCLTAGGIVTGCRFIYS